MRTFDTPTPVTVVLDIPAGRIRLIAADRTDTTVEVLPADASKNRDVKAADQTTVEHAEGVLRIGRTPAKNRILGDSGAVEVTVRLPTGSRLQATTASAELRGVGRLGEVTYESAHGSVKLDETTGGHLTLLAGDISVGRLAGPAQIATSKGDILIAEATHGTVTLRTEAGNVSIGAARGVRTGLDAGTGHGRIRNSLKNDGGDTALTIHATTAYGDITAHSL